MPETFTSSNESGLKVVQLTNRRQRVELSKTWETLTGDGKKLFLKVVHSEEADIPDDVTAIDGCAAITENVITNLAILEKLGVSRHFTK